MTKEKLNELFKYRDGQLYRRIPTHGAQKDRKAGCLHSFGYYRVSIQNKLYYTHRIIWIMHYGEIPSGYEIDHINGERGDNRIENLRLVTIRDNHKNKRRPTTNTSGVIGVNWKKERSRWRVSIGNGTRRGKFIGYFIDFGDAVKARKQAEKEYGFHENHGR